MKRKDSPIDLSAGFNNFFEKNVDEPSLLFTLIFFATFQPKFSGYVSMPILPLHGAPDGSVPDGLLSCG